MKKSIITFLAAASLVTVAAPVVVSANNNLGTTYTNASQRITDYIAAVQAFNAQKAVVAGIESEIAALNTQLASEQVAFDTARAIVVAFKNATTAEQQEALKVQYGVTYDEALKNDEAAFNAVQATKNAITEAEARLATEAGKLPALEAEVARTEALLTPAEKAAADKGEVPAPEAPAPAAKKEAGANPVKPAATATGSKALPKTSAAK